MIAIPVEILTLLLSKSLTSNHYVISLCAYHTRLFFDKEDTNMLTWR